MSQRNVVSWNTIIAGYAQNGNAGEALTLFSQMQLADMKADSVTMVSVLTACAQLASLHQGNRIHGYALKCGLESDVVVGTSLVDMYGKCGSVDMAYALFDKMPRRNVVSWSAMITAYAQNGYANKALTLFNQMQLNNMEPNSVTMVSCVLACARLASLQQGKCIHGYIIKSGFETEVVVGTALIDMYARCKSIDTAEQLFKRMPRKNLVSWNAMLTGYAENSDEDEAFILLNQMLLEVIKPNSITMVSALSACSHPGALQQGKWIHGYMIQSNFEMDIFVENSLVAMYARCGDIEVARQLFETMSTRNVVSWNTMIAGYVQSGHAHEAFALLNRMQPDELPDSVTLLSVLPACAHLAALQQGKSIHCYMLRNGFELDVVVGTALVDMYAKCGKIHIAQQIFDSMSARNVVSWNTIIAGYGMHGHGKDALELFETMQNVGTQPDHITFVCVLTACSHAGMVEEGWDYFNCMTQDYSISPRAEHYACMVDLLGRAGHIDEALDFVKKMPIEPGASVLGALLGACRIHNNIEIGEHVADLVLQLEPQYAGYYVLLSNIYAAAGRWNDVVKVRKMMKYRGIKKIPGYSLIEVNNRVHTFIVEDRSHPQSEKIYATLETLSGEMEEAGYVPNTNFVLHNVDEQVKESTLYCQ
jgi:pentatricopeptide repeat protein